MSSSNYAVPGYYVEGYANDAPLSGFIWKYHRYSTDYPESGFQMELGGSYQFTSEPDGPDQRLFTLHFETMRYFTDSSGNVDATISPELNFLALENFYKEHRRWKSFTYDHPIYGLVKVRFAKPLRTPKGILGGDGALEPFSIDLLEIPE